MAKRGKNNYQRADTALTWMLVVFCGVNFLLRNHPVRETAAFLTLAALPFTALSGYMAYLNRKLPKEERKKANWHSVSDFSVHPYFTFAIFLAITLLGLWGLLEPFIE